MFHFSPLKKKQSKSASNSKKSEKNNMILFSTFSNLNYKTKSRVSLSINKLKEAGKPPVCVHKGIPQSLSTHVQITVAMQKNSTE